MTFVVVDLDTLALSAWRDDLRPNADAASNWDTYHAASIHDPLDLRLALLVQGLARCEVMVDLVTDRPERWMILTQQWLIRHEIPGFQLDMRPENNWLPAHELKRNFVVSLPSPPAMVISDNAAFLELCRDLNNARILTLETCR